MRLVKCPEYYYPSNPNRGVFLAGGITNCPDWQADVISAGSEWLSNDVTFIDPRRDNFDVDDPSMAVEQIKWEYEHLYMADSIFFWFPEETLCPITLFELGVQCGAQKKQIFVGTHPNYGRRFDVIEQVRHAFGDAVTVRDSLTATFMDLYYDLS